LTTAAKSLSAIPATQPARVPATAPAAALPIMKPQTHAATWDLAARHLMLTWPIPSHADDLPTHAALTTLARLLMFQLAQDADLQKQLGPILVAPDLACPESNYFSISATLRPGSDFTAARTAILNRLAALATANDSPIPLEQLSPLLVQELDLHDAAELRAQVPAQMTDGMIEAQLALTWATSEYRFRPHRTDLQNALRAVTFDQIQQSIAKRLTPDQCTTLQLSPKD